MLTPSDVRDSFDTSLSDEEVQSVINATGGILECLQKKGAPPDVARLVYLYAVRHLLFLQNNSGRGGVRSESAPSGASRSFFGDSTGDSSPYVSLLKTLDQWGCTRRLVKRPGLMLMSVGGPCSDVNAR